MRLGFIAAAAVVMCIAGCLDTSAVTCDFGVCPEGRVCDEVHDVCVAEEQLRTCIGDADGVSCDAAGEVGTCKDQVCLVARCGDGVVTGAEDCDGDKSAIEAPDCEKLGYYDPGTVTCNDNCTYNVEQCHRTCGDGVVDDEERCDGFGQPAEVSCLDAGGYASSTGTAICTQACTLDVSGCERCGDHEVNGGELCEPDAPFPSGTSCIGLGFDTGRLECNELCGATLDLCVSFGFRVVAQLNFEPTAMWHAGPRDAFIVGARGSRGVLARWNGQAVEEIQTYDALFTAVHGSSPTNVIAIGTTATNESLVVRWNGTTLSPVASPPANARSVFVVGSNDAIVLDVRGNSTRLTAGGWTSIAVPPTIKLDIQGVWGTSATDFWYFGRNANNDRQYMVHVQSGTSTVVVLPAIQGALRDAWGVSATDVFAVGENGSLIRVQANVASAITLPVAESEVFTSVEGTSVNDILVASESGRMFHFDGQEWSSIESGAPAPVTLTDAFDESHHIGLQTNPARLLVSGGTHRMPYPSTMNPPVDAWVGPGARVHVASESGVELVKDGVLSSSNYGPGEYVWGAGSDAVFVVGGNLAQDFDGTAWHQTIIAPVGTRWAGMWGLSPTNVWAITDAGDRIQFTATGWNHVGVSTLANVTAYWGFANDDQFAATASGVYRDTGAGFVAMPGAPPGVRSLWGSSANDLYAAGVTASGGQLVYHFDGTWTPVALPTDDVYRSVSGTGPSDVWLAGVKGVLRFDGVGWSPVLVSTFAPTDVFASERAIVTFDRTDATSINVIIRGCATCL